MQTEDTPASAVGAKRSRLEGGAISEEAIESSPSVLHSAGYRSQPRGLQQFFSPQEASQLAHDVFTEQGRVPAVIDPTAGNGALLEAFPRDLRFGVEIDPDQVAAGDYTAIAGDLQRVYPLLKLASVEFPALVLNPPFGLDWTAPDGTRMNSTRLACQYALGLMRGDGQAMLICGRDRFWREVAPDSRSVWCVIEAADVFDDVDLPCVIAFLCQPDNYRGPDPLKLEASRSQLPGLAGEVRAARAERCGHIAAWSPGLDALAQTFRAIEIEHKRRLTETHCGSASRYDLALQGDRIAFHASAFAKVALTQRGLLRVAEQLNSKSVHYFALNLREWRRIREAGEDGALTIDPRMPDHVDAVVRDALRDATPLYPVKPQMRLGFLEDLERLKCVKADPERGFVAGERYRIDCDSKVQTERDTKLVQNREGELESRDVQRERKLLTIRIAKDPAAEHSFGGHKFDEGKESIEYLVEHFELPDPGDIGSRFPHELARAKQVLDEIEQEFLAPRGYRLKQFQVDDLGRLLVKGKGPLGWDTGLGKTLGQLVWAEACRRYWRCQNAALFVMPQDLLEQFEDEASKFFGRSVERIQTPADAKRVDRHVRRGGEGWYATHYEALSRVGRKDEPMSPLWMVAPGESRFGRQRRDDAGDAQPLRLSSIEFCPACHADVTSGWNGAVCDRCGYVHKRIKVRTAASLLATTFRRGVICVDELSETQGEDSLRGKAVRGMRCRHPLGGTGTPISNYVDSAFYGLWWCCGNASSRFPYDIDGKAQFERDFCVIEHMMGKEGTEQEGRRQRRRILPEVTNVSVFWRLVATNMVRRRKEDTGEPIVPRYFRPIEVPMGKQQLELQRQVLKDFVRWFELTHPDSPLVKAGVVEQFAAGCGMLPKLAYAATMPEADPDHAWWGVPATNWTPANMKVLEKALEHARQGDKVLIGSSLIETGRWVAERLQERNVHALHIVEDRNGRAQTKNPRKRAAEIKGFKHGDAQVLCCGVQAVKLGHNLDQVNTVIVHGLPWTHLALKQFVDRAWRLSSQRPVTVWVVIPRAAGSQTISERQWNLVLDKGAASDLALDGQLIEVPEKRIDWGMVLREMRAAGVKATGDELDEEDLRSLWERAEGPYAPLDPPAPVSSLADRLVAERPSHPREEACAEGETGQLAFDLAA
jgi:hypothetical protein